MEACFNDISVLPIVETNADSLLRQYANIIKHIYSKGYNKVRYDTDLSSIYLFNDISIRDLCKKNKHEPAYQLILSTFTQPGIDETNDNIIQKYVDTIFNLPSDHTGNKANCFAYAYASNSICIGFASNEVWKQCMFEFEIIIKGEKANIKWPCISCVEHFSLPDYLIWEEQNTPLELLETDIIPTNKKVHITDDHGKDVLLSFSDKLKQHKYIDEIYSAPYRPHTNQFIYRINPNGEITIVLTNTPQHLSLTIKTTGRNLRETTEIARIIKQLYNR